jgi:acyl carrier protein
MPLNKPTAEDIAEIIGPQAKPDMKVFEDLMMDSVDFAGIIIAIEEKYGVPAEEEIWGKLLFDSIYGNSPTPRSIAEFVCQQMK